MSENEIKVYDDSVQVQQVVPQLDLMQDEVITRLERVASILMHAQAYVPDHIRKNKGDCFAVAMQSAMWRMNPFVVASGSHITQSGTIGYNAQLINSVVMCNGPVVGRPCYEFFGDWDKILGKVSERVGKSGGKYYIGAWDKKDEEGLGVTMTLHILGEDAPTSMQVLLKQCWPRFSTQWATDPQQQIIYAAGRKFARRYFPDVIGGVYTHDELEQTGGAGRQITGDDITVNRSIKDGLGAVESESEPIHVEDKVEAKTAGKEISIKL